MNNIFKDTKIPIVCLEYIREYPASLQYSNRRKNESILKDKYKNIHFSLVSNEDSVWNNNKKYETLNQLNYRTKMFNSFIESGNMMIFSCDRYPKEIEGLEDRLKSRFGWGLSVVIDPPALETRTAILLQKAEELNLTLPEDCAFFIAQQVKSNVRELEGALKRVAANAKFAKTEIDLNLVKDSLRDVLAIQAKMVTIGNIQRVVADYYHIKLSDLLSKRRNRSITRPRQMAMSLAKELTNHSLPEIGEAFGGRDHTTVIHACDKTKELMKESLEVDEDYKKLRRSLSA